MCTISMISDGWRDQFPNRWPNITPGITSPTEVTRSEFDALKKEMQELKELLKAAKRFDEVTNQPNCETEEKVKLIRSIADMVGVDVDEVFGRR